MQCKEIIQVIEATFPRTAALGFDNVGLLAGRSEKEVSRIYLALDATDVVIDRAIKEGADMLITHHPLLFSAVKKVTDEDFITRRIVKLIQNDIPIMQCIRIMMCLVWQNCPERSWIFRMGKC